MRLNLACRYVFCTICATLIIGYVTNVKSAHGIGSAVTSFKQEKKPSAASSGSHEFSRFCTISSDDKKGDVEISEEHLERIESDAKAMQRLDSLTELEEMEDGSEGYDEKDSDDDEIVGYRPYGKYDEKIIWETTNIWPFAKPSYMTKKILDQKLKDALETKRMTVNHLPVKFVLKTLKGIRDGKILPVTVARLDAHLFVKLVNTFSDSALLYLAGFPTASCISLAYRSYIGDLLSGCYASAAYAIATSSLIVTNVQGTFVPSFLSPLTIIVPIVIWAYSPPSLASYVFAVIYSINTVYFFSRHKQSLPLRILSNILLFWGATAMSGHWGALVSFIVYCVAYISAKMIFANTIISKTYRVQYKIMCSANSDTQGASIRRGFYEVTIDESAHNLRIWGRTIEDSRVGVGQSFLGERTAELVRKKV